MENISLFALIREDFATAWRKDPAIISKAELFFTYPGVWAVANYRIANYLRKKGLKLLSRMIMGFSQFVTNIDIHPGAKIGRRLFIDHGVGVVVGETAEIGDDVTIYQNVTLGGVSTKKEKRHPTVMDGAVIGAGAKVLGNIIIGKNAKIGSNSVVVKEVPDDSTAVGIPARVITKGRSKDPSEQNKLPDIDKQMFEYLIKRVAILEQALVTDDKEFAKKEIELQGIYDAFLQAIKN